MQFCRKAAAGVSGLQNGSQAFFMVLLCRAPDRNIPATDSHALKMRFTRGGSISLSAAVRALPVSSLCPGRNVKDVFRTAGRNAFGRLLLK